nr:MAG TPA: hypothetical protein [Ackermannviridae sp.]
MQLFTLGKNIQNFTANEQFILNIRRIKLPILF